MRLIIYRFTYLLCYILKAAVNLRQLCFLNVQEISDTFLMRLTIYFEIFLLDFNLYDLLKLF